MNRQETLIPHICAPLCGKSDSLYGHGVENILGRCEASRGLHVVVMPAKQKVRAEVEILLPAVARDVWRVRDTEASPPLITFVPRFYCLDSETVHPKVERRCQVCPKSIAVQVGPIESIPGSIDRFALCVLRGMESFRDKEPRSSRSIPALKNVNRDKKSLRYFQHRLAGDPFSNCSSISLLEASPPVHTCADH